jgi:hypothetical protein
LQEPEVELPEPEPAEIKKEPASPPVQQDTPKPLPPNKAAVPKAVPVSLPPPPMKPDRAGLNEAIRATHGDLRKLSRVLRTLLGWSIEHNGKRHPIIRDGNKKPVAPIPTTGHAATGTIAGIANTVCHVAGTNNLLSS